MLLVSIEGIIYWDWGRERLSDRAGKAVYRYISEELIMKEISIMSVYRRERI